MVNVTAQGATSQAGVTGSQGKRRAPIPPFHATRLNRRVYHWSHVHDSFFTRFYSSLIINHLAAGKQE
jgi:hypothetical protein